jgi:hypothetical protein
MRVAQWLRKPQRGQVQRLRRLPLPLGQKERLGDRLARLPQMGTLSRTPLRERRLTLVYSISTPTHCLGR